MLCCPKLLLGCPWRLFPSNDFCDIGGNTAHFLKFKGHPGLLEFCKTACGHLLYRHIKQMFFFIPVNLGISVTQLDSNLGFTLTSYVTLADDLTFLYLSFSIFIRE